MNLPLKISIVTVVYNGEKYLEECMDSVLRQGYPNLEYIVIDGGSTDRSVEIIQKYSSQLSYWVSEKDAGMYDALNKGFRKSTGELMAWINSDDLLMPGCLFLLNDLFQKYPEAEWVQGLPLKISPIGYVFDHFQQSGCVFDYYLKRYPQGRSSQKHIPFIQQESTFWRRALWEKAGGFLSTQYKLAGDFELWMRFFEKGTLYQIRGLVGGFRIHESQLTQDFGKYVTECSTIVDAAFSKLPKDTVKQIRLYRWLLRFEGIPVVSRIVRLLFGAFYRQHIELKYIR